MKATYSIPEMNLQKLQDAIAKLNRKADRIGVKPVAIDAQYDCVKYLHNVEGQLTWLTEEEVIARGKVKNEDSQMAFYAVTIEGEYPKFDGWEFIAVLEPLITEDGAENIIKTVPGKECPLEVTGRVGDCDHCRTKRYRTETFVVRHESGEYKVVGRQCLAAFLGGKTPAQLAAMAEFLFDLNEMCDELGEYEPSEGGFAPTGSMLDRLLAVTATVIDAVGWRSKASCEYGGTSTASIVSMYLNPPRQLPRWFVEVKEQMGDVSEHDGTAEKAIEWARSIDPGDSSYLHNVRLIARCEWVRSKHWGIACSIMMAYLREVDRLKEQARRAALPPSEHVGSVKERLTLTVTCNAVFQHDGYYGMVGIHKMVSDDGAVFTWFASESAEWLEKGCKYVIKGTVKGHDEYKGVKQTVLTRVKIVEELSAVEAA